MFSALMGELPLWHLDSVGLLTDARSTTMPVEPGLVGSVALRAGHDASVADDQIERRAD